MKMICQSFDEASFNEVDLLSQSMGCFLSSILDEIGETNPELSCKIYGLLALNANIKSECKKTIASTHIESNTLIASSIPTPSSTPHYYAEPETIGTRIKSMRELRNLGQFHLAGSVGVTRSCVEAWEEGITIPASDKIIPLASALNCDPMWLLTGGDGDAQPADASPHASLRR